MAKLFQCPSCSGRLQYDGGDHATVRCDYCGSTVIVPEELRSRSRAVSTLYGHENAMHEIVRLINDGRQGEAAKLFAASFDVAEEEAQDAVNRLAAGLSLSSQHINMQLGAGGAGAARRVGCIILTIILITVVATTVLPLVIGGFTVWSIFSQDPVATGVAQIIEQENPVQFVVDDEPEGYAAFVESFGSEGIAPGQFVDPRALAVAPDGQIYVADYSTGRVQRFDSAGVSQGVWQWDAERVIQALDVGVQDDLYAVQGSKLVRLNRASGEPLGELTYESVHPVSFNDVAVAPDGEIVALNHFNEYVRFDAQGNVLHVVDLEAAADVQRVTSLALDGRGNVYLLGVYQDALRKSHNGVFLFSREGRYLSRFGSDGDEPGQFTSPSAIAVDGQGRIYVSDFPGILTFSNSGAYLGVTDPEGFIFGIAFNSQGQMLAVGNANKLFRYDLPAAQ